MPENKVNFPETQEGVRNLSWAELRKMIEPDKGTRKDRDPYNLANLEMAKRIVNNNEQVVTYYMGVMNVPLINKLYRTYKIEDAASRLYEFLSEPFSNDASRTPKWEKINQYKGVNEDTGKICRLKSYTSTIASRKFYKEYKKELKIHDKQKLIYLEECLPNILFIDSNISDDTDSTRIRAIRAAFPRLCEAHQITLELLIIKEMSSLDAFEILKGYMHPRVDTLNGRSEEEYFASLTTVEKQNRVGYLKGQALNMFGVLVEEELVREELK